ncbi:MAG: MFS transporter [Chloroflexi bacterium]|nr:MFS transporter [Chloroflexota bacterium]
MQLRTFQAFNNRDFRCLWLGHLGTTLVFWMEMVSRSWLVWQMTNDPFLLGLVNLFRAIPLLVFSFPAGVAADRFDRKQVLMASQMVTMVMHAILATLIVTGSVQVWQVFLTAFITGAGQAFINPTRQALVPALVSKGEIMNAIGLTSAAMNTSRILGPSLAGGLIGVMDIGAVFYLQAAAFIAVIIVTNMMRCPPYITRGDEKPALANIGEGLRYIKNNHIVLTLLLLTLVPMVFGMPYMTLMPVFADDIFHIGASGMGMLTSSVGIGALLGAAAVASAGNLKGKGKFLLAGAFGFGAFLLFFALSQWLVVSMAVLVVVGIASASYVTITNSVLLTIVPHELHGRVMSVYMMDRGLVPLGSVLAGAMAAQWSAPIAVGLMGSVCALLALATALTSPRLRRLD